MAAQNETKISQLGSTLRTAEELAGEAVVTRVLSQPTAGLSGQASSAQTVPHGFSEPTRLSAEELRAEQDTAERLANSSDPRS